MNIGIVQLSDIHFRKETDHIIKKLDLLSSAISAALIECNKLFIVVSGDISDTGENYQIAKTFFTDLKEGIKIKFGKNYLNSIDFIFIPGNHDCFLPENDEIRQILIDNFKKNDDASNNIIDQLLLSQEKFWDFYEDFLEIKEQQKISYLKSYMLKADLDLNFYCYNTSWMSQRKEKPGESIFPVSKLLKNDVVGKKRIDISIHHHPASW